MISILKNVKSTKQRAPPPERMIARNYS